LIVDSIDVDSSGGSLRCEYLGVRGGVLADAIGYGKTACTIGLIDKTKAGSAWSTSESDSQCSSLKINIEPLKEPTR
jgi:hypothetical protein